MKRVEDKNRVEKDMIRTYQDIDGLKVIEEYLLFKGTDSLRNPKLCGLKELEHMAHVVYGLKVNPTNKLYVGMYLEKYFKRKNMVTPQGHILVPEEIFNRVDQIHKSFKGLQPPNQ